MKTIQPFALLGSNGEKGLLLEVTSAEAEGPAALVRLALTERQVVQLRDMLSHALVAPRLGPVPPGSLQ